MTIAEKGLRISDLTHRVRGFVDIGGQGLDLHNSGIDNHGEMNVTGPIRGNLHHFTNHHVFYADSLQPSTLTIQNWSNSGQIYLSQSGEIYSQDSFKNTGGIFVKRNSSVGCRKKPDVLGMVVAEGEIKAIIDEALDDAIFQSLFNKVAFLSKKRKLVIERAIHTDHYLNTTTNHHVNGRYTHSTQTGYLFQRRTTERKKQEIDLPAQEFPAEIAQEQQRLQGRRAFLNDFKASLKDRLKSFAAVHANHKGLLAALIKGLGEAGLSDEDISDILSQDGVQSLIDLSSSYDQLEADGRKKLQTSLPEVGSFLNGITAQTQRLSLPVWQWAQRNGPEFVEGVCNLAILASRYTTHPAVAVPARVCTLGQMAPKVLQNLQKAQIFFSKKHEGKNEKVGGIGTVGYSQKPNLTAKQKEQLQGVPLRGQNPGNVPVPDRKGRVHVDTELLGGEKAARKVFKELTGREATKNFEQVYVNGRSYIFRKEGNSGHSKIEITDSISNPSKPFLEKISFLG